MRHDEAMRVHESLKNGYANEYTSWLERSGNRADLERPGTRHDAIQGYSASLGLHGDAATARRIRVLFGLRQNELQHAISKERLPFLTGLNDKQPNIARMRELLDAGLIDPAFFAEKKTLDWLEDFIKHRARLLEMDDLKCGVDLLSLPIPESFFTNEQVSYSWDKLLSQAILNGIPNVIRAIRITKRDAMLKDRFVIDTLAKKGIDELVMKVDFQGIQEYATAFNLNLSEPWATNAARKPFATAVSKPNIVDIKGFLDFFPNVRRTVQEAGKEQCVVNGLRRAWLKRDRVMIRSFENLLEPTPSERAFAARDAILTAYENEDADGLAFLHGILPTELLCQAGKSAVEYLVASISGAERSIKETPLISVDNMDTVVSKIDRIRQFADLSDEETIESKLNGFRKYYQRYRHERSVEAFARRAKRIGIPDETMPTIGKMLIQENFIYVDIETNQAVADVFRLSTEQVEEAAVDAAIAKLMDSDQRGALSVPKTVLGALRDPNILFLHPNFKPAAITYTVRALESLNMSRVEVINRFAMLDKHEMEQAGTMAKIGVREAIVRRLKSRRLDQTESEWIEGVMKIVGLSWAEFSPAEIPVSYLIDPHLDSLDAALANDPWREGIRRAMNIQGRTGKEDHDPWISDGERLLTQLIDGGVLDRASRSDGDLIPEYVKIFGVIDLPKVARIFFDLKRKAFDDLSEADRSLLVELVGPKASRLSGEHLINELRMAKTNIRHDIIDDKRPRKIDTVLGEELFRAELGPTDWETNDKPRDLLAIWENTVRDAMVYAESIEETGRRLIKDDEPSSTRMFREAREAREGVTLPEGYQETTFTVPRLVRRGKVDAYALQAARIEVLSDAYYAELWTSLSLAENESQRLSRMSDIDDSSLIAGIEERIGTPDQGNQVTNERTIVALTINHILKIAQPWGDKISTEVRLSPKNANVRAANDFLRQYLLEHYLNPKQDPAHTGHVPFPEPVRLAILRAWGFPDNVEQHPVFLAKRRLDDLKPKGQISKQDLMEITIVPVQEAGRIFSGELANACYTSKHKGLARGEYPGLKAAAIVTNRNKPNERLNGSILFIETYASKLKARALVVRANNPRKNLVAQVDATSLVREMMRVAVETARRRKIKHVGIVLGDAGSASSNREEIADVYESEYADLPRIRLESESETNFNDYDVWNEAGATPTVLYWTNDDPDAT